MGAVDVAFPLSPSGPQFLSRRTSAPWPSGPDDSVQEACTLTAVPTHKVDGPLKELGEHWKRRRDRSSGARDRRG